MIYEINGVQVIFDFDLAVLYGTETKRINEAVRRNKEKFPEKYSWILTDYESNCNAFNNIKFVSIFKEANDEMMN